MSRRGTIGRRGFLRAAPAALASGLLARPAVGQSEEPPAFSSPSGIRYPSRHRASGNFSSEIAWAYTDRFSYPKCTAILTAAGVHQC